MQIVVPAPLLHTILVPLVMFPEAKFYNASMTKDARTFDAVSPKFEEIPDEDTAGGRETTSSIISFSRLIYKVFHHPLSRIYFFHFRKPRYKPDPITKAPVETPTTGIHPPLWELSPDCSFSLSSGFEPLSAGLLSTGLFSSVAFCSSPVSSVVGTPVV